MSDRTQKSKNHIAFIGTWEYFTDSKGNLYGAPIANWIQTNGYRCSAQWECPAFMAAGRIEGLQKNYKDPLISNDMKNRV